LPGSDIFTESLVGNVFSLRPKVILNKGHDFGADHWSLGVLTYEMLTCAIPFYENGMDQMELFRNVVKGSFDIPKGISPEAQDFLKNMLQKQPTQRLGSLSGGIFDIYNHPWFKSIDFRELRKMGITPPFVPKIKNPLDASNFESWDHLQDKSKMTFDQISPKYEAIFENF
jgi:serine/threonine protein kinase